MKSVENLEVVRADQRDDATDASTRRKVQESIMQHGPSTAAELADRLHLTAAGIRRHLSALTDDGVIAGREQRVYGGRGRGRPAKVFALTDLGRAGFAQDYDTLAIQALTFLADHGGPEAVRQFALQRIATVEAAYHEQAADNPTAEPAQILADALSQAGYVASTRPAALGVQVCQHHCPVAHVAEEFPEFCEVETEAFARLLGVHVQRLATIAHGDGVCTTHVPTRLSPATPHASAPGTDQEG